MHIVCIPIGYYKLFKRYRKETGYSKPGIVNGCNKLSNHSRLFCHDFFLEGNHEIPLYTAVIPSHETIKEKRGCLELREV